MRDYRDLQVWTKAHSLTLELYRLSRQFLKEELYDLVAQLRRAASSIGANLAESCGRQTQPEFARFTRVAMGSASELDYHLLLARDLGLLKDDDYQRASKGLTEIRKMLTSLLSSIKSGIGGKARP
jgi:four helix bundle protein